MPRPRLYCSAFNVFIRNKRRADVFLEFFDRDRGPGNPSNQERQMLLGAIVFSIGSLDAFLHDLVLELVPAFAIQSPQLDDALKAISKDDPSLALRIALTTNDGDRRRHFSDALDAWLSGKSFQGPSAVVRALGFVGCSVSWAEFDSATSTNAAEALERFTTMRHNIVHRGLSPTVTRQSAVDCIMLVEAIARRINDEAVMLYR